MAARLQALSEWCLILVDGLTHAAVRLTLIVAIILLALAFNYIQELRLRNVVGGALGAVIAALAGSLVIDFLILTSSRASLQ